MKVASTGSFWGIIDGRSFRYFSIASEKIAGIGSILYDDLVLLTVIIGEESCTGILMPVIFPNME